MKNPLTLHTALIRNIYRRNGISIHFRATQHGSTNSYFAWVHKTVKARRKKRKAARQARRIQRQFDKSIH